MLVNVNKLEFYKYMESEVQKQEQHMPLYREQIIGGFQAEDCDTKVEDEDCVAHKPQMQHNENEE